MFVLVLASGGNLERIEFYDEPYPAGRLAYSMEGKLFVRRPRLPNQRCEKWTARDLESVPSKVRRRLLSQDSSHFR